MEQMEQEINDFHREDYFWAQIAAEVRRSYVKTPKAVKDKSFMHRFTTSAKQKVAATMDQSKAYWKAVTGYKGD